MRTFLSFVVFPFIKTREFHIHRYPGVISNKTLPGGGTTDYAIEIYYEALRKQKYTSFLRSDTALPMMYMPDCIRGTAEFLLCDDAKLKQRTYNLQALSFTPGDVADSIRNFIPEFEIDYKPDFRQEIADSWPNALDDSNARRDWQWQHEYDLDKMTADMLDSIRPRVQSEK